MRSRAKAITLLPRPLPPCQCCCPCGYADDAAPKAKPLPSLLGPGAHGFTGPCGSWCAEVGACSLLEGRGGDAAAASVRTTAATGGCLACLPPCTQVRGTKHVHRVSSAPATRTDACFNCRHSALRAHGTNQPPVVNAAQPEAQLPHGDKHAGFWNLSGMHLQRASQADMPRFLLRMQVDVLNSTRTQSPKHTQSESQAHRVEQAQ